MMHRPAGVVVSGQCCVACWCSGQVIVGLVNQKVTRSTSAISLSANNLGQVVHTLVPLSPSSIIWYLSRGGDACGWEGNRRSGVALAMCHNLQWFTHLRAHGLDRGMSTPPMLLAGNGHTFPLLSFDSDQCATGPKPKPYFCTNITPFCSRI